MRLEAASRKHKVKKEKAGKRRKAVKLDAASKLVHVLNSEIAEIHTKLLPLCQSKSYLNKFFRKFSTLHLSPTELKDGIFSSSVSMPILFSNLFGMEFKTKYAEQYNKVSTNSSSEETVELLKTTNFVFSVKLHNRVTFQVTCILDFKAAQENFDFILKNIGIEGSEAIIHNILSSWWVDGQIPPIFDTSYEVEGEFLFNGPVKLGNGEIVYLPTQKEIEFNQRDAFLKRFKELGTIPPNKIIMIDPKREILYQTNSTGEIKYISLRGSMKMVDEDFKPILEKSLNKILFNKDDSRSLNHIWDFYYYFTDEEKKVYTPFLETPLHEFYSKNTQLAVDLFSKIKKIFDEKKTGLVPSTRFKFGGLLQTLVKNVKDYDKIATKVNKKREQFEKATPKDVPTVPYLRPDGFFFPHQAEGLTKLSVASETAILDVSTGGGKSLLQIVDGILCIANKGIKHPLLVMPGGLIPQFLGEVNFFTNGQLNAIAVTTETFKSWGPEKLAKLCETAPINTIFLTTYSFLTNGSLTFELAGMKFKEFPNIEWIKKHINPGYISFDESHFLKNFRSSRNQAALQMRDVPFRRICTGTLIGNTPSDLPGQVAVLDPLAIGDNREFAESYGADFDKTSGKVFKWKSNAADLIRNDLQKNTYYTMYREKNWASLLPGFDTNYFFVEFKTKNQEKVYKDIVESVMKEIQLDPELKALWEKFIDLGSGDTDEFLSAPLLAKFAKMEQYLTAPDRSEFIQKAASEEDKISPKIETIDERIKQSIDAGYKCIVAVHFKKSARHLYEHSKFKDVAVYYDASHKDNITKFKTDPKCKVIFCVIQSVTEGQNLQVADRIIVADNDWTAGKLKQLVARIFRPHVKLNKESKKLENLNKDKKVFIDVVLCNNTADIAKFCYQTYKKIFNSAIMEKCPVSIPIIPRIDIEALTGNYNKMQGKLYLDADKQYNNWFIKEVEDEKKKGDIIPIQMKTGKPLPGSKEINVPWVDGMPLPVVEDQVPLEDYMEDNNIEVNERQDKKEAKKLLYGAQVRTQWGYGKIIKVGLRTVTIEDEDGETVTEPVERVVLIKAPKLTKEGKSAELARTKKSKKEVTEELDSMVYATLAVFNELPLLIVDMDDPDSEELAGTFKKQGPYWYLKVKSKVAGSRILKLLQKKFDINSKRIREAEHFIKLLGKDRIKLKIPADLKSFYKIKHTKSESGSLKLYCLVINNNLFFVADKKTHPGVNMTKYGFKLDEGYWYYPCKTRAKLSTAIKFIQSKKIGIANLNEVVEDAKDIGFKIKNSKGE